jgi:glycolate oxidase iron-sulfur subunit
MATDAQGPAPLGTSMPGEVRFVGTAVDAAPRWGPGDAPAVDDLNACVACGLCLPHCPTWRLTREEPASPRGRIEAMRAVADGARALDPTFTDFMDRCLVCRACEDVCPSHVPFGRMMERARAQIEPRRGVGARLSRWFAFHWLLPHPSMIRAAALFQPLVRPFLPSRLRRSVPTRAHPFARLPTVTEPASDVPDRGTVHLLAGCVQDRWFHEVNRATIRVLARNGWRVVVPRDQACCGALAAHNGRLEVARRLVKRALHAFGGADSVVVNAAGCSAHMRDYEELVPGSALPVHDLMRFLHDEGLAVEPGPLEATVAYHDACHALRAQGIHAEPRALLARIPGLSIVEIPDGDRCCGAAGTYALTQPELSEALLREKTEAIASTGAAVVASANPGCSMQLGAGLTGSAIEIVHPVQLLDRAYAGLG